MTATEFAHLHSIFLTILENELGGFPPVPEAVEEILNRQGDAAAQPVPDEMGSWLDLLDLAISPQRLRNYGQRQRLEEPAIRVLLRFWVAKNPHSSADRDKVDWLATYLFRIREEEGNQPAGWAKSELQDILQGIAFPSLSQNAQVALAELPSLIQDITDLQNLNQITDARLLEQGRSLKKQVGEEYFHPAVLAAIINYNLMLGKRFEELMKRALDQTQSLRTSQQIHETFHEEELIWDDYHTATHALHQLSELSRAKPPEKEEPVPVQEVRETFMEQQLKRLGIDSAHEDSKVRRRIKDLATHLRANPAITSIRICGKPLPLKDWESQSFRILSWQREPGLRGEVLETITRAIALVLRIEEELYAYQNAKSLGDQWRKHFDSLFYLLCEGLRYKETLLRLSFVARKSGDPEMSQHLALTAEKLQTNLAKVSELF